MAAARTLVRLNIDQSQPIDIFKIVQDEGIWLMFQPLKNLFGAYVPQAEAVGIIVHSKHPLSLQRFTAAHEFGHYILQHPLSVDDEGFIERARNSSDLREVAADTFAAHFLMPLQLVNTMLVNMGLPRKPGRLTGLQVYQLALDMGVSYTAAVNHLATLRKITLDMAEELRKQTPKSIKEYITGRPLENSWADIRVLDQADTGKQVRVRVYDEIRISLPEVPSTGFVWTLEGKDAVDTTGGESMHEPAGIVRTQGILFGERGDDKPVSAPLALVSNEFEVNRDSEPVRYGSGGNRYLTFRTLMPGRYTLRLLKRRPWQMASSPAEVFEIQLDVLSPKLAGESDTGLIVQQQPLLMAA